MPLRLFPIMIDFFCVLAAHGRTQLTLQQKNGWWKSIKISAFQFWSARKIQKLSMRLHLPDYMPPESNWINRRLQSVPSVINHREFILKSDYDVARAKPPYRLYHQIWDSCLPLLPHPDKGREQLNTIPDAWLLADQTNALWITWKWHRTAVLCATEHFWTEPNHICLIWRTSYH